MSQSELGIGITYSAKDESAAVTNAVIQRNAAVKKSTEEWSAVAQRAGISQAQYNNALRGTPAQISDVIVSLQGGMSPMTVFMQQGFQLRDMFNGWRPAAQALTGSLVKMVNPWTVAGAAVVSFGVMAYGAEQRLRQLNDTSLQFIATGRRMDTSAIDALIGRVSQLPGVTRTAAADMVSAYAPVRQIGSTILEPLLSITKDYAAASGIEAPAAAKKLADAFKDPVAGAKQLDEQLGILTNEQRLSIQSLVEHGREAEAQRVLLDALTSRVRGLANEGMTPLQRATDDLSNSWGRLTKAFSDNRALTITAEAVAKLVSGMAWLVENGPKASTSFTAFTLGSLPLIGMPLQLAEMATRPAAPVATGAGAGRGRISPSLVNPLAPTPTTAEQDAWDKRIAQLTSAASGYESTALKAARLKTEISELEAAIKRESAAGNTLTVEKLTGKLERTREDLQAALKKGSGSGAADDPTKRLLDNQLRDWDRYIAERGKQLTRANRETERLNAQGLLSIEENFSRQRQALDQATADQVAAYDKQIAALEQQAARAAKATDRAEAQGKLDQARDRRAEVLAAAQEKATELDFKREDAQKALSRSTQDLYAQMLDLNGATAEAAGIRWDLQMEATRKSVEASLPGMREWFDTLRAGSVNQAQITKLTQEFSTAQGNAQIQIERISNMQRLGAISELEALQQTSAANRELLDLLRQRLAAYAALDQASLTAEQRLAMAQLQSQVDTLGTQTNLVASRLDTTAIDAFGTALADITSGSKSVSASFKDMGTTIFNEMNSLVMKDLGKQLYQSLFGGAGGSGGTPGGWLSGLFGAGGSGGGAGGGGLFASVGNWFSTSFAGWFAEGGTLGAGQWGIAGEAGAEVVHGPATITPMHKLGGSTINQSITYQVAGRLDKRTQDQIARDNSRALRRAQRLA